MTLTGSIAGELKYERPCFVWQPEMVSVPVVTKVKPALAGEEI